jgi:hypothetical protein
MHSIQNPMKALTNWDAFCCSEIITHFVNVEASDLRRLG